MDWGLVKKVSNDIWKVLGKHRDRAGDKGDPEWWGPCLDDFNAAARKYRGTPVEKYAREYATACVGLLDQAAKEAGGSGK